MNFIEFIAQKIEYINNYLAKIPYIANYLNEIIFAIAIFLIVLFYFKSKLLERYLMKELVSPFFVTLFTVTFVLLLDEIMDLMRLIIEKDLDFFTVIQIFSLALPFLLALSIPMSVLMATIISFGRLSTDSEIIAIKSGGINIFKIVRPIYLLALLLSFFMIYFNNSILPETNHKFSNIRLEISMKKPMKIITPGEYIQFGKYTVFVKSTTEDEMQGIIIYDRTDVKFPKTIVANRGRIVPMDEGISLKAILFNGEMHERDSKVASKYTITSFDEFTLNITGLDQKIDIGTRENRSEREMSSRQLVAGIKQDIDLIEARKSSSVQLKEEIVTLQAKLKNDPDNRMIPKKIGAKRNKININKQELRYSEERIRSYKVEYHKKYALAFACLIFAMMGIPLGIMTKSSGIGTAFSVSAVIFLIYYVSLIGGERLADKGYVDPGLAMWISNILFSVVAIVLTFSAKYERSFLDFTKLKNSKLFKRNKK